MSRKPSPGPLKLASQHCTCLHPPCSCLPSQVRAFVESDRLLESVWRQLPCNALGLPTLPPGPEAAERLLVALFKLAWTSNACPAPCVHPRDYMGRVQLWGTAFAPWDSPAMQLAAFVSRGQVSAPGERGRRSGGAGDQAVTGVAAQCLHLLAAATYGCSLDSGEEDFLQRQAAAAQLLEAPGALDAAAAQLAELQRRHSDLPELTAQQLLYVCHLGVAGMCTNVLAKSLNEAVLRRHQQAAGGQGPAATDALPSEQALARYARLLNMASHSSTALLKLDPSRVSGLLLAGQLLFVRVEHEKARQHFEQGLQLARQQRSDWFVALCASRVIKMLLLLPGQCNSEAGLAQVKSSSDGWGQAEPALGRMHGWLRSIIGRPCECEHVFEAFPGELCRALSPAAQVQALLKEAEGAWKSCKRLLPERWLQTVRDRQGWGVCIGHQLLCTVCPLQYVRAQGALCLSSPCPCCSWLRSLSCASRTLRTPPPGCSACARLAHLPALIAAPCQVFLCRGCCTMIVQSQAARFRLMVAVCPSYCRGLVSAAPAGCHGGVPDRLAQGHVSQPHL